MSNNYGILRPKVKEQTLMIEEEELHVTYMGRPRDTMPKKMEQRGVAGESCFLVGCAYICQTDLSSQEADCLPEVKI